MDAGAERVHQVVRELDPELVSLYLLRYTRIYDLTLEDPVPDDPEGQFFPTPDGFFVIDVLPGGELGTHLGDLAGGVHCSVDLRQDTMPFAAHARV